MGNNGSKTGNVKTQLPLEVEQQWAHSYPRNRPKHFQHKVLPEREINRKLKTTNNGEILQSGGTLSGRHLPQTFTNGREDKSFKVFRLNSSSSDQYEEDSPPPFHIPRQKPSYRYTPNRYEQKQIEKEQMKRFGSEPDLRESTFLTQNAKDKYKARKKYKAPPPPNDHTIGNSNRSYQWGNLNEDGEPILRHPRLFKTKAELSRKSSPVKSKYSMSRELSEEHSKTNTTINRLSLPEMRRSVSVPEFQLELKETIERIRGGKVDCETQSDPIDDPPTIAKDEIDRSIRNQPLGKESTPVQEVHKDPPAKTFYFGMEQKPDGLDTTIENFAATLLPYNNAFNIPNLESDISSELEMDDSQVSSNGIALQLRPILPKKQLEIPRFSPAAAWKLLSSVEATFTPSTIASDEIPVFMEERIEKISRQPPPLVQVGPRSNYDKSGDSGISGDAGPAGFDDNPEGVIDIRNNLQLPPVLNRSIQAISWTPQQDLGEDESSTDDELQKNNNNNNNNLKIHNNTIPVKFSPRPNVFSLSLPRDNLSAFIANKNSQQYIGLQKLKRSVSGVLNGLNNNNSKKDGNVQEQSENWFLSKSAPNSLNNGFNSLELQHTRKIDEIDFSMQNMSRVMYLPESRTSYIKKDCVYRRVKNREEYRSHRNRSHSAEKTMENLKNTTLSKSCENISTTPVFTERASLQDPPVKDTKVPCRKPKRFTFQSTIRQIELKRLADKLSREAEKKEKQRLSELEAMQKVEEEFQKKRAREKASIRQQLRLFSLDDTSWSSLPPQLEIKEEITARSDPDGAISSSTSTTSLTLDQNKRYENDTRHRKLTPTSDSSDEMKKTPMTQILSEYRQTQREYKDFRSSPRLMGDFNEYHYLKQTIHPQVTCDMPKVTDQTGDTQGFNYRKQFAHGVKTNSTYSDDSQRDYSPKIHSRKTHISRF